MNSLQSQVLTFENQYWQAMRDHDVEKAISLTHFPCLISGPEGSRQVTEADYRKIMATSDGSLYKNVKIESPQVEVMNENTAIITYSAQVKGMKMLDTSLWIKDGDNWTCGYHSEFPEMGKREN